MELEKLEVIIEANMQQVEKQLESIYAKFGNFFNKIESLSGKAGSNVEKNLDISKGQQKMLDQLSKINQSIKEMSVNADRTSKGTGEKIGTNITTGISKARTQVKKDLNSVVTDIQDKLTVARALQNKITALRGQREQYRSNGDANKVADIDLKIAKAQQQMNSLRNSAKATTDTLKREFNSVPDSLRRIENQMAVNEAQIEYMRKRIKNLNQEYNAAKVPTGSFSKGFSNVDSEQSLKIADKIQRQTAAMDKLIAKNDILQEVYAQTEDRAKALAEVLELLNNRSSGKIPTPMKEEIPATPTQSIPKYGGVFNRVSNAIAHGWRQLPKIFTNVGKAFSAFGNSHRATAGKINSDYRAMNSSFAAWRLSMRFLLPSLIIYNLLGAAIRKLAQGFWAALNANTQFSASLNQIKVNMLTAFYPIYTAILPAINALMSALAQLTGRFAAFMSMLFGKTFAQSKAGAQGLYNTVKAMNDTGSSAKKATDKAKELQRTLLGFDQINRLDAPADTSDSDASGSSASTEPTLDFNTPDYPVPDWMKYFKPILDAWDTTGQKVMDAWKYALGQVSGLITSIGRSLSEVWNNGSGQALFEQIFQLLANILNIIGDIAKAFRIAWDDGGRGTALIQSIFDMFTNILELLNSIAVAFRNAWNDGVGVEIAKNILDIFTGIFNVVGTLAERLRIAWETNNLGQSILSTILGIFNDLLGHIDGMVKATEEWAKMLDFTPLLTSIQTLLKAIQPLADNIGAGLEWLYKNVLLPLAGFTIENIIPDFINILAGAINVLNSVIGVFQPLAQWLWDSFLEPIAKWTAGVADKALKAIADALNAIGDFIDEHQEGLTNLVTFLLSFVGALKAFSFIGTVVEVLSGVFTWLSSIGGLSGILAALGEAIGAIVSALGGPLTIAIAAAVGAGVLLWKNWDAVKEAAEKLAKWVGEKWDGVKKATSEAWDNVSKWTSDKWNDLKKTVSDTASTAVDNVRRNWKNMIDDTGKNWQQLANDTSRTWENVKTSIGNAASNAYSFVSDKWNAAKNITSRVWSDITNATNNTWNNIKNSIGNAVSGAVSTAGTYWERLKNAASTTFNTIVGWAGGLGTRIAQGINSGLKAVRDAAVGIFSKLINPAVNAVNGVKNAVTWILGKVGVNIKWGNYGVPQLATGTDSHVGGPALVNDAQGSNYREAFQLPNGKVGIFPATRNLLVNLPKGTKVLSGDKTAKLYGNGIPRYANGIGEWFNQAWTRTKEIASDIWSYASNPKKLLDAAVSKFINFAGISGTTLDLAKGTLGTAANGVYSYVKSEFGKAFKKHKEDEEVKVGNVKYNPTAGVEQWRSVVKKALSMLGLSGKRNEDLTLFQMSTESSGNPNAINNWDINARNGVPSKGLMQVIDPTFRSYALPGYNKNIYDPLSNILASLRYAMARYGSLDRAFRGVGYANGGLVSKDGLYRLAENNMREMVIPLEKPDRALSLIMEALDYLGAGDMSKLAMPEVFDLPTPTPTATTTTYNGGGMQQFSDSLMNQLMLMLNGFGTATQTASGDIVINIGGTEFGRIAVSEINNYHNKIGRVELNI